jgi:hypothetical protein
MTRAHGYTTIRQANAVLTVNDTQASARPVSTICLTCHTTFDTHRALLQHCTTSGHSMKAQQGADQNVTRKLFFCPVCTISFGSADLLRDHVLTHDKPNAKTSRKDAQNGGAHNSERKRRRQRREEDSDGDDSEDTEVDPVEAEFRCETCALVCKSAGGLTLHKKRIHGVIPEPKPRPTTRCDETVHHILMECPALRALRGKYAMERKPLRELLVQKSTATFVWEAIGQLPPVDALRDLAVSLFVVPKVEDAPLPLPADRVAYVPTVPGRRAREESSAHDIPERTIRGRLESSRRPTGGRDGFEEDETAAAPHVHTAGVAPGQMSVLGLRDHRGKKDQWVGT